MLEGSTTEDLQKRWEHLAKLYQTNLSDLKDVLMKTSKTYDELVLIKDELVSRDIEVNDECLEEMKKTS